MKPRRVWFHAALLSALFLALVRPHRLWVNVSSAIEPQKAAGMLSALDGPASPSLDEGLAAECRERAYAIRGFRHQTGWLARGENLGALLLAAGASREQAGALSLALKPVFDPRRARAGDAYDVLVDPAGGIRDLTYRVSPLEVYRASARGDGWAVARVDVPVERREGVVAGQVSGSLFESFLAAGGDAELVMAFVDLFRWDVDFVKEAREGDVFRMIHEDLYVEGAPVGHGKILAASYQGSEGEHVAVYYESGAVKGHFDLQGETVEKSFLRSPLKFSRISSAYSLARRHPILDVVRPHRGVDYAAPVGTPVWSIADGRVVEAGRRGAAGNSVIIRHPRGYESTYSHLARFPKGLRAGSAVKQGQVIGFVGSTGLSTGPHLDFRMTKLGTPVNPLREKYMAGEPVPPGEVGSYRAWARRWVQRLEDVTPGIAVAQAPPR